MIPDAPTLVLVLIIALIALSLTAISAGLFFNMRAQRLPAATRYEDIRERLALGETKLLEKQAELREVEKAIHERDRYAAEAAVLKDQVDALRLAHDNLAPARQEIEEVKAEAADVAAERVELEERVNQLRTEADQLQGAIDPERVARLQTDIEELERERNRVRTELEAVKPELDAAMRVVSEARTLESRLVTLTTRYDELETEVSVRAEQLSNLRQNIEHEREELAELRSEARDAVQGRETALQETEMAQGRLAALKAETETLEALRDTLRKQLEISTTGASLPNGPPTPEEVEEILRDLVAEPACLALPAALRGAARPETEALHGVERYLGDSGLTFSQRTVRAFHTALKVNDTAQLTVLAGVSGTGKSLLPRRYAEAMGIHFLQVAVEPRWDSPQDLLGFYNYVEKKYRATELSRLLAHMDPWQSHGLPEGSSDRRDHMAIVLLDEMNLARVEYYFSEFLSRLEARPTWRADLTSKQVRDSLIPVDIRGLNPAPVLYPAHNILFVGTMNDDESTQSLSDKVLDRGNILQFPAPGSFPPPAPFNGQVSDEAQSFTEWRGWIAAGAHGRLPELVGEVIGKLAGIMQDFGKPFGHRLNQSMQAYVAQYPRDGHGAIDVKTPLADQVEFRILPKLRGVEIANHQQAFEALEHLVRQQIDDPTLADRIADTRTAQEGTTGLFVWRGMTRQV